MTSNRSSVVWRLLRCRGGPGGVLSRPQAVNAKEAVIVSTIVFIQAPFTRDVASSCSRYRYDLGSTCHTPAFVRAVSAGLRGNLTVISGVLFALCCGRIAHPGAYQVHFPREAAVARDELSYESTDRGTVECQLCAAPERFRRRLVQAAHCTVLACRGAVVADLQTAVLVIVHGAREASSVLECHRRGAAAEIEPSAAQAADDQAERDWRGAACINSAHCANTVVTAGVAVEQTRRQLPLSTLSLLSTATAPPA